MMPTRVASSALAWAAFVAVLWGQAPAPSETAARKALDLLLTAQYSEFNQLLNAPSREKLTADFLRDYVGADLKSFGTVEEVGKPMASQTGDSSVFTFPVRFSKTTVNIQLTLNAAGEVASLHLRPARDPAPAWNHPSYSHAELFQEHAVTVGSDDWKLGGTLTLPVGNGPFPGVVLVHGPGPNDRDEAIFATKMFADIAEGLSSRGIAVLRYDKRTKIYGPQMSPLPFTLNEETVEDAVRALALLRTQPGVDPGRVFVLGHSLGGYAAPRIAKRDGKLAGVIVLAGNARRLEDISLAQAEAMLASRGGGTPEQQQRLEVMKEEAAQIRNLAAGKEHPDVLLGHPVEYFLDLQGYNAPAAAKLLDLPMLFLQGDRDFQVTMADFALWKASLAGAKNVVFSEYPALNHLFTEGQGTSSPDEYRKGGNVAPEVIADLAAWISKPQH